ncbi:MAG TPA: PrsW family glutamic-type intramembrane protease [Bacteroidia bacterium]|nr:PrsW family glutamic-type intramembrane protease [Bacteroidia bacterium]
MDRNLLGLTIGPGIAIAIFIYWKDKLDPEPRRLLIRAFLLGCASIAPAILLNLVLKSIFQVDISDSLFATFAYAFFVVGVAEEFSKFMFLRWNLFTRPEFDEPYDGITYSVMIGMGFATLENVMYVYQSSNAYEVALMRAFTAVPAHATFAIAMGYYTGLAKFERLKRNSYLFKGLLLAIVMHGFYDFLLMQNNFPQIAVGAFVSVGVSIYFSMKAIKLHQQISPHQREKKTGANWKL